MSGSLKIEWSDALNSGDRATDVQHKFLIDVINDLAEAIEESKGRNKVKKILHELKYYTLWHFGLEEKCMAKHKCPMAEKNKDAHQYFIDTFIGFENEVKVTDDVDGLARKMYKELTSWLVNHIMKVDGSLKTCKH